MILEQPVKIILLSLILSTAVVADENDSGDMTVNNEVITPENMSAEDGKMLNEYSNEYNHCLRDISIKQMEIQTDSRQVVDYAMKACAEKLYELDARMKARNFDPDFRDGYLRSVSNRSANNILRFVMMSMANSSNVEPAQVKE